MAKIKSLQSYEILASNGLPTIEVRIELENGIVEFSSISYGASAGSREAMQLVDKSDSRFKGNGMLQAISNINEIIVPKIIGRECEFLEIDKLLLELDPTFDKSKLGGNAILSVSQAICKTQAKSEKKEIYELISDFMQIYVEYLPMPNMVMIEGGKHADNSTDLQEYALAYQNDTVNYLDQIRILEEIYLEVKKELKKRNYNTNVGNEGAFAPSKIVSNIEPVEILEIAIANAGYSFDDVKIYIDAAASEFCDKDNNYTLIKDNLHNISSSELMNLYKRFDKSVLGLLEDPFSETDFMSWEDSLKNLNFEYIVADDLTVSNAELLEKAILGKCCNAVIIKPNQVGTITETLRTCKLAKDNKIEIIVSHRGGGESNDDFIADLAVGVQAKWIKCGPTRGERVSKYNRLLRVARKLGL
ncbi:phosphopyruvate hydratase [bacterium]|nr:MAG: phosphopyruvate hydratase [bacterium]